MERLAKTGASLRSATGSPDCPLIRLYDFAPAEAEEFGAAVSDLAAERVRRVEVHKLPGVRAVKGCRLTLCLRSWDQAVLQVGPLEFECGFTRRAEGPRRRLPHQLRQ